jgi:hypothetical protein
LGLAPERVKSRAGEIIYDMCRWQFLESFIVR